MEHLDHRKKLAIMFAVMAAMLFAALNQTIVGTALPRIIADLGGFEYYSWVFTVYMLAATVTSVLAGKLSDIYGRKPLIIAGIIVFIIGSLLCGLAANIVQMILYRGIQGLGGGIILSAAFTVVGDLFVPRERGRWQGMLSAVFGLASVFGPTLGGYIVDHTDWKWVFWVFLPFGIVALVMIAAMLPATERREGESVDYLGSILLTTTIVPMLLAFSWAGQTYAWSSPVIVLLFAGALLSLFLFIFVENIAKSPVLPLYLFRNNVFTVSNAISFVMGAGMFGAIMYMPFFVQGVIGTSATISGYVMMPMTLSLVIASAIGGNLITKTGKYKKLALGGLFIMTIGMVLLSTMNVATTNAIAILYMIVVGFGLGIGFPVFTLTVQNAVEDRLLGVATASSQLFRQLGGTIGVSIMGTILNLRVTAHMNELAEDSALDSAAMTPEIAGALQQLQNPEVLMDPARMESIHQALPASMQDTFAQVVGLLRESLSYALSSVFLSGALMVGIGFLMTFLLKEIPLRTAMQKASEEPSPPAATRRLQEE